MFVLEQTARRPRYARPSPALLRRGIKTSVMLEEFKGQIRRSGLFHPATPIFIGRAPGRLDVMGGIADYSGALVLQWPIRQATRVALRPWSERRFSIVSIRGNGHERRCDVP